MNTNTIENIYELSAMQQGILFHSLYETDFDSYCFQFCYTLCGKLNVSALEQAWQQVIERHTILRTSFHWEELEKPLQVVHPQVSIPLKQYDWSHLSSEEQQKQRAEFLKADHKRGFNFAEPPLMRLTLIKLAPETYLFVWSKHHLILDGWSTARVVKEVFESYEALMLGRDCPLSPSSPYSNYIDWVQQQDISQAEQFWRRNLKGFTAPTSLKANQSQRDSKASYYRERIELSLQTTEALQSLAKQHQLTLNTLVQGAYALLLSRYSGEEDVLFGSVVSGRPPELEGVESMVGLFINTLPVRVQVLPEMSLLDWLKQVQSQQLELRQYQYSPLVKVQAWSEIPSGVRMFESLVVFENYPLDRSLGSSGKSIEVKEAYSLQQPTYPLEIIATVDRQLYLIVNCDGRYFDSARASKILAHLKMLLKGMVANPHQRLGSLPLLTQTEQQHLQAWNNTKTPYPQQCIHQLFELQATQTPQSVAVIFQDQQLTYQELNERANQVANYLKHLGVGTEDLVGIYLFSSIEMIVGLLGILKAGGTYLPLDPSYPQQRLALMLEDAQISLLLTNNQLREQIPEFTGKTICLDGDWSKITEQNKENLLTQTTPDNLAYVMYTSGSTGTPKGVCIPHRGVVRLVKNNHYASLNSSEVFLQFASISFDAATFEIWGCLLNGARLVLFPEKEFTLSSLGKVVQDYEVTTLWLTAGLFHLMVDQQLESLRGLRQLLAGGDVLNPNHVRKFINQYKDCRLINGYGPTENTTFTCCYSITDDTQWETSVPIGYPIANTQVYVLDRYLRPVPIGIAGELYIGGEGLARSYWNRPDLTQERFIDNPFQPKTKLYKTGDLVCYRSDGTLEFLGRLDQQVKIRGFRIELGEIESTLSEHPAVAEVTLALKEDTKGEKRIVAYVVCHREKAVSVKDLRDFLQKVLPDYMLPSVFVFLDKLPLTSNGKVDRQALPVPDFTRPALSAEATAPRTPQEKQLAEIWANVMNLEQVGIHDNFFELGGHSLVAIQIISRIREVFAIDLGLNSLFETPTIAQLAQIIQITQNNTPILDKIVPISRDSYRQRRSQLHN
ncbi:amino acid adenylation domain protein (plasmid) [Gloeothece citriformis PCC 7424]|uniref:Amino acid adenylation domain protein n=1 Tax=Gloeothece citriformis (strain PCC 7424) TaxID=65393 RepID=B7KLZ5_GLOC7|nr:non-ribosomal peptide synthetase [Gloeothece citriformis]ACK73817.1 amino acid adenylation domain protein [Gloeothece citriformis PCC 7424]